MNKELCFIIEKKNLYLEHVLVDYMDIPIFFLCKGENQYYIALCIDIEELRYIVTKLSLTDVYNLLHGKISMRDVILKQGEYWLIKSGVEISLDVITKHGIDMLDISLLPETNAYFEILTKETEMFVQQFDQEYFAAKYFSASIKKIDLNEEIESDLYDFLLGNINQFTELVDYKIEKESFFKEPVYCELMNHIKSTEVTFKNPEESKRAEMVDSFKLVESTVNNIAAAA